MNYYEKQYERVARYLDGEDVSLSQEELELAEEVRSDETALARWIESRDFAATTAKSVRRNIFVKWAVSALAAAAVVLIAVNLFTVTSPSESPVEQGQMTNNEMAALLEATIADLQEIDQQQQQIELTSAVFYQTNGQQDDLTEDMNSNYDKWLEVLSSEQSSLNFLSPYA